MKEDFTIENGSCHITKKAVNHNPKHMLPVVDWLSDIPTASEGIDLVEVQFKNTRKGYYHNASNLPIEKGSVVIVESNPGCDMGEVTLIGKLVQMQIQKNHINTERYEIRNIIRLATEEDHLRAEEAHAKEQETMIKARQLAKSLGLEMKIGDVEYQGDGSKAIFYYIAEGRVDFRQLIKVYAETFRVRIEMKQIGARQEAGRIGGTGPCGRELCCSTWMTQFTSVGTSAARIQNLSLNPQKLAGQCAKLKCCLNYEIPVYEEATKKLPSRHQTLETQDATYYYFSADPLKGEITYSTDSHRPVNLQVVSIKQAKDIIEMNRRGEKPASLGGKQSTIEAVEIDYQNVVGQDDLTRFDKKKGQKSKAGNNNNRRRENRPRNNNSQSKQQQ
jgi:cell fate regulator YaaT (PSP1 superfamily)